MNKIIGRSMWSEASEYERLKSLEREDDGLEEPHEPERRSTVRLPRRVFMTLLACNALLFIASVYILWAGTLGKRAPSEWECAQTVSPWSPLWEAVEFWEGNFDNDFAHPSKYRGPPTLELQKTWDDLWGVRGIGVGRDDLQKLNKTDVGQYIEIRGSDPDNPTYGAAIEALHQLHCLNVIRQYTWPLEMYDKSWGNLYPSDFEDTATARVHVDHCIETLRLSLMCYADVTPALLTYDKEAGGRRTDFNTHHKCRNFEKIMDYIDGHGVQVDPA
ncbi:Cyclochlorotine biosynthesis protein O [Metarhizium brunneum]|uniref:Cyclochlorotine biosynthesis protein O n=1 Tax=Metarhizium brunneum TaxID=500148 RepID=A0A7D5UQV1_9HYPO